MATASYHERWSYVLTSLKFHEINRKEKQKSSKIANNLVYAVNNYLRALKNF